RVDWTMRIGMCCAALLAGLCLAAMPSLAQTQEEQQLKDKVQQLEQLTQELKARITALEKEKGQASAPQLVNTTLQQNAAAQAAQPEKPTGTPAAQVAVTTGAATTAPPQGGRSTRNEEEDKRLEIYGYTMLDMGYNFGNIDPAWFDVMRPSKLPAFPNQF